MKYVIKRLANFYIDTFLIMILDIIFLIIENTVFNINVAPIADNLLTYFICFFIYYFFFEFFFQKTIAKYITKTKIEFIGTNNRAFKILIRTLARLIPLEPISIFFSEDNRMWHDTLSSTKVIEIKKEIILTE